MQSAKLFQLSSNILSKLKESFAQLKDFLAKLKDFLAKLKEFSAKLKVSENPVTSVAAKWLKKQGCLSLRCKKVCHKQK